MRQTLNRLLQSLAVAALSLSAVAQTAPPDMGWSSWNTYGLQISDTLIMRQAEALVQTGLSRVGYRYVNIDDGYFGGRDAQTGTLLIHPQRFPRGLRRVVDHIHSLRLKAGIYSDAGHNTCGHFWGGDSIGAGVGMLGHDEQDCLLFFRDLDFDFIKVDFCGGRAHDNSEGLDLDPQQRYTAIRQAIRRATPKDIHLNICRWDYPGTWVDSVGNSWRTTYDIADNWENIAGIIQQNLYLSAYSRPGHYNDMDMLEVGRSLTPDEDHTHFALWCIMASPLFIGADLTSLRPDALALLSNPELIALNQDPLCRQAYVAARSNGAYILAKDIRETEGQWRAFAAYNPADTTCVALIRLNDLQLGGTVQLRDLTLRRDLEPITCGYFALTLRPHATRVFSAHCSTRLERRRYEAEHARVEAYQELVNHQVGPTAIYEERAGCSNGALVSWLGSSEANSLEWNAINSHLGGRYTLTLGYQTPEPRRLTATLNGHTIATIDCPASPAGTTATLTLPITLQRGNNTLRLSNPAERMPDIDFIELNPISDL